MKYDVFHKLFLCTAQYVVSIKYVGNLSSEYILKYYCCISLVSFGLFLCVSIVLRLAKAWGQQYGDPIHPGTECGYTAGHRPVVLLHLCVPKQPESFASASSTAAQASTRPERGDVNAHRLQTKGKMGELTLF